MTINSQCLIFSLVSFNSEREQLTQSGESLCFIQSKRLKDIWDFDSARKSLHIRDAKLPSHHTLLAWDPQTSTAVRWITACHASQNSTELFSFLCRGRNCRWLIVANRRLDRNFINYLRDEAHHHQRAGRFFHSSIHSFIQSRVKFTKMDWETWEQNMSCCSFIADARNKRGTWFSFRVRAR